MITIPNQHILPYEMCWKISPRKAPHKVKAAEQSTSDGRKKEFVQLRAGEASGVQ
jgi:hypothetical protein